MTYWYLLNVLSYPLLIHGILDYNVTLLLISVILMIINDVIVWQNIRSNNNKND